MVRQLLAELARLRAENAELKTKLDAALKHRFGRRSERRKPPPAPQADKPPRRRDEHGRSVLPEHLERREIVHDLSDAQKLCPCCGVSRVCIGEQTAEQLDLEPAKFFVLRTIKKSYVCKHCDPATVPTEQRLQTAGPAEVGPIAKGLCGAGLLAHVVTAKFADHTPVHRLAGQLARSGVTIASSTLGDWLFQASELLTPLTELMHRRLLLSRVIHGDDTGVKLRVPGANSHQKGPSVGVHRGCGLSVCGVRLHEGLHGDGAGAVPGGVQGVFPGRCVGPVRGTLRRGPGEARVLRRSRPAEVRGRSVTPVTNGRRRHWSCSARCT